MAEEAAPDTARRLRDLAVRIERRAWEIDAATRPIMPEPEIGFLAERERYVAN